MSDNLKEAEREMEKAIFISADCWLKVFDLLLRFQLGFGIAMISHRFDYYVDEHFKTRKWKLSELEIRSKIGENGANEMEIVNSADGKALPIPQNPLPNKVIGFRSISIGFIDHNVLIFLRRFQRFFPICTTQFAITTENVHISEFAVRNIWPMLKDSIYLMHLNTVTFRQMRQFGLSLFKDCPSLQFICIYDGIFPEFPPDDSANASDGQTVVKWLFTPRHDNLMKQLIVSIKNSAVDQWLAKMEQIKMAFSNASSPVSFVISFCFSSSFPIDSVVPFEMTNEITGEQLALSQFFGRIFELIRCPIASDKKNWKRTMNEEWCARQNQIEIHIKDDEFDKSLLDASSAGPSGDQKQQKMNCLIG